MRRPRVGVADLVGRAGFSSVAKGLRRLDALCSGKLKTTASLIAGLPAALELPIEVITDALRETHRQLDQAGGIAEERREAKWRAEFQAGCVLAAQGNEANANHDFRHDRQLSEVSQDPA